MYGHMQTSEQKTIVPRREGESIWLRAASEGGLPLHPVGEFNFQVLGSERAVGQAMFDELVAYAAAKSGDIVIICRASSSNALPRCTWGLADRSGSRASPVRSAHRRQGVL
jgi:hypothetical protein